MFAVYYTSIHKAALDGSVRAVEYWLDKKAGKEKKVHTYDFDSKGICPIHYAAERGNNHVISYLVERKCLIDLIDIDGMTAFMYAARENKLDTISHCFLLGARPWAKTRSGRTAIHFAIQCDHVQAVKLIVDLLIELQFKIEQARVAEEEGKEAKPNEINDVSVLEEKTEKKKPPEPPKRGIGTGGGVGVKLKSTNVIMDDEKVDEISLAAPKVEEKKEKEKVKKNPFTKLDLDEVLETTPMSMLIVTSNDMLTPLHLAAEFGSINCCKYLIEQGVPHSPVDNGGETPLHKAGRKQNYTVYRMLQAAGANENQRNKLKETPKNLLHDITNY